MQFDNVLDKLIRNPYLIDNTYKYHNRVELSGWVMRKPKFVKHDIKGTESCSFPLYQINNVYGYIKLESFSCMCYIKELVEQLKQLDNVIYIVVIGKVRHHKKLGDYSQIYEIKTLAETDIPLADIYEGKENETIH